MLTKIEKAGLRARLFRHLDGIVTAPTAFALHKKGVLAYLLKQKSASLADLTAQFKANEGYLNVALRVLCSQGWLSQTVDNQIDVITFTCNEKSETAFSLVPLYEDIVHLLKFSGQFHTRKFELAPFRVWERCTRNYRDQYGIDLADENSAERSIQEQILAHIEGVLVGPSMVHLGMSGMFHKYFMEASFRADEFHKRPESFEVMLDFFAHLGYFKKKKETYQFTEAGLFFAKRASAYGVTVSYIPTMRTLDELIFGNAAILRDIPDGANEIHVDREMNVWGSGGAHAAYFKVVDEVIIDLFNLPIEEQPKGILDMGCGNGAFIKHIFEVIESRTLRGQLLDEHPLFLVGADYNQAALKVTRANLIQADIWAKVIWGDIGRPDLLAKDLKEDYNIDLHNLLNVRTFLDHNRIWAQPEKPATQMSESTGAFAHRGLRISNNLVEQNLLEHFEKWTPYVAKFGLLVIELHTVPPELTAQNLGRTAATAYDATHGFSDQFIVEVDVFRRIAAAAGLPCIESFSKKFPDSGLATVTVNLLRGA